MKKKLLTILATGLVTAAMTSAMWWIYLGNTVTEIILLQTTMDAYNSLDALRKIETRNLSELNEELENTLGSSVIGLLSALNEAGPKQRQEMERTIRAIERYKFRTTNEITRAAVGMLDARRVYFQSLEGDYKVLVQGDLRPVLDQAFDRFESGKVSEREFAFGRRWGAFIRGTNALSWKECWVYGRPNNGKYAAIEVHELTNATTSFERLSHGNTQRLTIQEWKSVFGTNVVAPTTGTITPQESELGGGVR
jgi:hypothetical protein